MNYLQHVGELSPELQKKLDDGEFYNDLGLRFEELEPTSKERQQIQRLKREVLAARQRHEALTGELIEVEPPTPPNAYPEAA